MRPAKTVKNYDTCFRIFILERIRAEVPGSAFLAFRAKGDVEFVEYGV